MNKKTTEYVSFPNSTYETEAAIIQQRVNRLKRGHGRVTSDMVWTWIKERKPNWVNIDREKVLQRIKLD